MASAASAAVAAAAVEEVGMLRAQLATRDEQIAVLRDALIVRENPI